MCVFQCVRLRHEGEFFSDALAELVRYFIAARVQCDSNRISYDALIQPLDERIDRLYSRDYGSENGLQKLHSPAFIEFSDNITPVGSGNILCCICLIIPGCLKPARPVAYGNRGHGKMGARYSHCFWAAEFRDPDYGIIILLQIAYIRYARIIPILPRHKAYQIRKSKKPQGCEPFGSRGANTFD